MHLGNRRHKFLCTTVEVYNKAKLIIEHGWADGTRTHWKPERTMETNDFLNEARLRMIEYLSQK